MTSDATDDSDWEYDDDDNDDLCRANSGAIQFRVRSISGLAELILCANVHPYQDLFVVSVGDISRVLDVLQTKRSGNPEGVVISTDYINIKRVLRQFWLSWFNYEIRVGLADSSNPIITYKYDKGTEIIGYIKFAKSVASDYLIEWVYESSPLASNPIQIQHKNLNGEELRWVTLIDNNLPPDALIGGFEKEPIYIARAAHNGSLCPGKYIPSKRLAFVPWGGREHSKINFEILCGHNAAWEATRANKIPPNAFIGGCSEVRREPLYIGRAVFDGNLIVGKVHVIYHTCYLPYNGNEVEVYTYEVLVLPDVIVRSITSDVESNI